MGNTNEDRERQMDLASIKDRLLAPIRLALSPALLRTYLRTVLLLLTSAILFAVAVVAYSAFYYAYIPVRGITVPVYLQFDPLLTISSSGLPTTRFPYGIANVKGLVSQQKYDVTVEVRMPRSEQNLGAGNWMMGLEMRGPGSVGGGLKGIVGWAEEWDIDDFSQGGEAGKEKETVSPSTTGAGKGMAEKPLVLARSRRPAILTYRSWMTESAYRALRLPLYIVGWGQEEETVQIKMMEGIEFEKGARNVPTSLRLEARSKTPLEVYKVAVRFDARFEGLRWIMYRHWLVSSVVFTTLFWGVEISVLLLTWASITLLFGGVGHEDDEKEKKRSLELDHSGAATPKLEPGSSEPTTPLSDTSRTFPTLSSQRPLFYSSGAGASDKSKVKDERATPRLEDIPTQAEAEADDEDEDADFILEQPVASSSAHVLSDSGIGTSMESSSDRIGKWEKGLVRKRSVKGEK